MTTDAMSAESHIIAGEHNTNCESIGPLEAGVDDNGTLCAIQSSSLYLCMLAPVSPVQVTANTATTLLNITQYNHTFPQQKINIISVIRRWDAPPDTVIIS